MNTLLRNDIRWRGPYDAICRVLDQYRVYDTRVDLPLFLSNRPLPFRNEALKNYTEGSQEHADVTFINQEDKDHFSLIFSTDR